MEALKKADAIPATLDQPSALRFWLSVVGIGILTGLSAGWLTRLLERVQRSLWGGNGTDILDMAQRVTSTRLFLILLAAGVLTGIAQVALRRLSSGNDIDTTAAIWFHAGRLPKLRTLASATFVGCTGRNGCFAGPRRRTEAGGIGVRQLLLRPHTSVG